MRRALELRRPGEDTARAYMHLGEVLRVRGDHAGALQAMVDGEREAARLGLRGSFGHFMYVNAADDLLRLGRWDEAAERVEEAARMDLSRTADALRRAIAGQLYAARGELSARGPRSTPPPTRTSPPSSSRRSRRPARRSRWPRATRARRRHVDGRARRRRGPVLHAAAVLARAARRGRAGRARARPPPRAPDRDERRPDAARGAWTRAAPGRPGLARPPALARAERARVDGAPAPELWRAAARRSTRCAEPYPAAYARLHEAEATLLAGGERAAAAARARGRAPPPRALGAAPLRTRWTRSRGGAPGARRRARAAAAPDDDGVGLTARETEVLELLADGLTNREIAARLFISQKTVGAHMAHIYGKLGVHSRVEAAGRARQLGV